ncbi:MAG: anti-sigma-F factor Fin [Chloroflexota bacterium]
MRYEYRCDHCGDLVGAVEVGAGDEEALGFDALTPEERANIIRVDRERGLTTVGSICDDCLVDLGLERFGLADSMPLPRPVIH